MAKKQELVEGIEQELTCAVCLDRFTEPKVLPCLHTYCKGCIDGLVAKTRKQQENKVVCPKCREQHAVPKGGASGFTSNFTVKNLVELLQVHEASGGGKEKEKLRCENGVDDNVAVARCLNCSIYLCESCWVLHKKQVVSRKHETVSLEEIKKGGEKKLHKPQYCSDHEGEVLKLYCKTCSKPLCGDCTYVDHRDHRYVFIKDVRQELRQELEGTMEGLREKEKEFSDYLECLHKAQVEHKATAAACEQKINQAFDVFIQHLQQCRGEVLNELKKTVTTDDKQMCAELEATELSLARVTSNLSFTERLLKSGSDTEVASMAGRTLERARTLQNVKCKRNQHILTRTWDLGPSLLNLDTAFKNYLQTNVSEALVCLMQGTELPIEAAGLQEVVCGPNNINIKLGKVYQHFHHRYEMQVHLYQGSAKIPCTLQKKDDCWILSFVIRKSGEYTAVVAVNGMPVQGSPFVLRAIFKPLTSGARVRRGPDWGGSNADGHGLGTVTEVCSDNSVLVRWDSGMLGGHNWGNNNKYDIEVA